jgi:Skp family chaperone for outer membrane proteins
MSFVMNRISLVFLICALHSGIVLAQVSAASAAKPIALIVDSRDAYERVAALKALFAEVDVKIRAVRGRYESAAQPLQKSLEALKNSGLKPEDTRKQKAQLLLKLADLQKLASVEQQQIGRANEKALAQFDQQMLAIALELQTERGAKAVLQAQDLLYYRADCPCNVTEEIYKRINARLPKLVLKL